MVEEGAGWCPGLEEAQTRPAASRAEGETAGTDWGEEEEGLQSEEEDTGEVWMLVGREEVLLEGVVVLGVEVEEEDC